MMDTDRTIVGRIAKNARGEEIVIDCHTYKTRPLVSIRTWYRDKADGDLKPGREGFSITPDKLIELEAAIAAARDEAITRGWTAKAGAA